MLLNTTVRRRSMLWCEVAEPISKAPAGMTHGSLVVVWFCRPELLFSMPCATQPNATVYARHRAYVGDGFAVAACDPE